MPSQRLAGHQAVQLIYEQFPYPAATPERPSTRWRLPTPAWLTSFWRPGTARFRPDRILVAGCGTGREAFALARRVPDADIVAVDFSPRSIAIARASARRTTFRRQIRFLVADLADPLLVEKTGGAFDFISCHGVLSYVSNPRRVLRALARCATGEGALYLGVNGSTHHSVAWRQALLTFGLDPRRWRDTRDARTVLRVMDAIAARTPAPTLARRSSSYLASDVFGPPFRNLPLAEWLAMSGPSGWHFRGSASCGESLRGLCDRGLVTRLLPRCRAEVHALEELLIPSAFHALLLTKEPPPQAPWGDVEALMAWRVARLPLFRMTLPARLPGTARLASRPLNLLVETRVDASMASVLRDSRLTPIRDRVGRARAHSDASALRDSLYMLYLFGVIEMLEP